MKTAVAQRVVVMGREGQARDQLISALTELGMTPVWVGKPVQSNPEQLGELNPNRVIVSLEPSIELELEPYSDFLSQPSVMVLYDDAETTRTLSGWDLQRWARHMAAKLLDKDVMPSSSIETAPDADQALAESLPAWNELQALDEAAPAGVADAAESTWQETDHYEVLDIDSDELNAELEKLNQTLSEGYQQEAVSALAAPTGRLTQDALSSQLTDMLEFESLQNLDRTLDVDEPAAVQLDFGPIDDVVMRDSEVAPATASTPEPVKQAKLSVGSLELQSEEEYESFVSELTSQSGLIPDFDLSKYALVSEDTDVSENAGLKNRDEKRSAQSLFLVISGSGGLVALRTLLSLVNADFTGILAIYHEIDAGQLQKLRDQFQKITDVPIVVLDSEEFLKTGAIYLLPKKHTLLSTALGYQCVPASSLAGYIDQMDRNSKILILSGADAQLSQQLIQVSSLIHNIHVQSPEDCFEPTLAQILVNAGAPVISQDVMEHWFN
jgi:hypothetical protein